MIPGMVGPLAPGGDIGGGFWEVGLDSCGLKPLDSLPFPHEWRDAGSA